MGGSVLSVSGTVGVLTANVFVLDRDLLSHRAGA
jgi:hypothetical protein